jgi:hypothetical protein
MLRRRCHPPHHSITPLRRMNTPLDDRTSKSETFGLARFPAWIAPLLLRWARGVTLSFGVKSPPNLSVFAAAAFALAVWPAKPSPK